MPNSLPPEPDQERRDRTHISRGNPEIDYAGQADSDTVLHEFWDLSIEDIKTLADAGMAPDPDPGADQREDDA